jgi:hypothetical protein
VLLDALVSRAQVIAPTPDTGDLEADLQIFLTDTFKGAAHSRPVMLGVPARGTCRRGCDDVVGRISPRTAARP